jgi:hypothetical protein
MSLKWDFAKLTLPRALEKEAHDKHLQPSHGHHHETLNHAKVENASLGAAHGTEVAVLARAEVLLVTGNRGQHCRHFHDRLLDGARLLGAGALFGWKLCFLLVFDLIFYDVRVSAYIAPNKGKSSKK